MINSSNVKPDKKKRGRKPKNNIIVNDNPVFNFDNNEFIVKLNIQELDDNMLENNIIDNIVEFDKNISEVCWNCCNDLKHYSSIPIKYCNNTFFVYGDFCCLECGLRYMYDNFNTNNYLDILTYTNLYNKIINNNDDTIDKSPHRLLLKKFGGKLSIDEYHLNASNYKNHYINIPIGTHIYHNIDVLNYSNDPEHSKNMNLKLYRKNNKSNSDIKSIMNL